MTNTWRKGSVWRHKVQTWLNGHGWATSFRQQYQPGDDITAIHRRRSDFALSIEAKNHKSITLADFVDQAERQAPANIVPVVFVKRHGKPEVDDCYVVMSGRAFATLIDRLTS